MNLDTIIQFITDYSLFGNELWRYLVFLLIILLVYPPLKKISAKLVSGVLTRWAEKTSIKFDDMIVKSLNPPINMFIFAAMFYIASSFINPGEIKVVLDKVFSFLIIVPIVYFLIKFTTEFLGFYRKDSVENKRKVNEAAIDLLMQIIRVILVLIGVLLILGNLGYDISALLAGLGVGGLAFALAAQDILKNFFAGIALIFDKTFGKGERVTFEGRSGFIEEVKMRSTKLRTYDGELLTIPNAMLADNIVENVTKVPRVKVSFVIGVTYDTSAAKLKKAKEIIFKAIKDEVHADEERSWIYFDQFGAYSLDIKVIYYSKDLKMNDWPQRVEFKERINFAIKEGFEKAKIEMAFPTQTVEVKKVK